MKNWKYLIMGIIAGIILGLCCSCEHNITKGVITKKIHRPMYTTVTPVMCGKTVVTSTVVHPESWSLVVRDGMQEECFSVSRVVYEHTIIGDSIKFAE